MTAAPLGIEPAAIALFEHDYENFTLTYPRIISLTMKGIIIHSTSEIWLTAIMRRGNQEFPTAAISLERDDESHGHWLTFPIGAKNLKVMVDYKCLDPTAMESGCLLQGGELVRVYTTHWFHPVLNQKMDERAGPLSFQYRSARKDYSPQLLAALTSGQRNLDHMPKLILRMMFAFLPVDECLHVIPAVCSRFLDAAKEKMTFHQWELAGGCPTPREAAFCQGWAADESIVNVVLTRVPLTTMKEWHSLSRFLETDLKKSGESIKSIECNLITAPPAGIEKAVFEDVEEEAIFKFMGALASFAKLEHLKITGLPFLPLTSVIFNRFHHVKKLSLQFGGSVLFDRDSLAGPLMVALQTVCLSFQAEDTLATMEAERFSMSAGQFLDRMGPEEPCNLEDVFGAFCPSFQEDQQRVLVLKAESAAWNNRRAMLASLKRLDALSLSLLNGQLVPEVAKTLILTIPRTVRVLHFMLDKFDDELCQAVANRCPHLETFACNGADVTEQGVHALTEGCRRLESIFLLETREDGLQMAREDNLPKSMVSRARGFGRVLQSVFF